jgi:plasmid stabilization system protein ParE
VTRRRVRFTETSRRHVELFNEWWRENSPRPEILHEDLEEAVALLAAFPGVGSPYPASPIPEVRRLYIERLMSHLYYTFDEHEVVIRALWHARRGSGPDLSAPRGSS